MCLKQDLQKDIVSETRLAERHCILNMPYRKSLGLKQALQKDTCLKQALLKDMI